MKRHTSQSGSALAIVAVILVVALLGALGFIFWQNVLSTDNKSTEATAVVPVKSTDPNADLTETIESSLLGNTINLKYPTNWQVSKTESGDIAGTYERTTILAAPGGNVVIEAWEAVGGGLGGTCDPASSTLVSVQPTDLMVTNAKLRYIEAIDHFTEDTYSYDTQTTKSTKTGTIDYFRYVSYIQGITDGVLSVKTGDSGCDFGFSSLFSRPSNLAGDRRETITRIGIKIKNLDERQDVKQVEITQAFASDDYKTAKRILLTLINN